LVGGYRDRIKVIAIYAAAWCPIFWGAPKKLVVFQVEICALLRYYVASGGNCLPTFRDNVSVPSSTAKSPRREESRHPNVDSIYSHIYFCIGLRNVLRISVATKFSEERLAFTFRVELPVVFQVVTKFSEILGTMFSAHNI
jgi:hypothetical protein